MNTLFSPKVLLLATLAAIAAGFGYSAMQSGQTTAASTSPTASAVATSPAPPPAPAAQAPATLPPNIPPSSPLAQVIKLAQAGLDKSILMAYISNCTSTFNLDSDKIIYATDAGVPNEIITAMMQRDQTLQQVAASQSTPAPQPQSQPQTPPPAASPASTDISFDPQAPVTVNYFYSTLSPYGTWIQIPGYGTCWRPNVVVYDQGWMPYCDRGNWVYTDCGWYWMSDYSWGCTFHYGRWFRDPRWGWCWWPDTVWGPSWVTWRSADEYCGWAPLPPFAVWNPSVGFIYQGNGVSVGFDFGLESSCYVFVSTVDFCNVQLRGCRLPPSQVTQVFNNTTVINNINVNINRTVINNGLPVQTVARALHRQIEATTIHELRNTEQRAITQRNNIRAAENQRRDTAEAYATQQIQNNATRQQQQRERVSEAAQRYNTANANANGNNAWQPVNAAHQQEAERTELRNTRVNDAQQDNIHQNVAAQSQAAANAERQAAETKQEQLRQQVQQEQSRQAQAIADAQSRAQQAAQAQAAQRAQVQAAQQQAQAQAVQHAQQQAQAAQQAAQSQKGDNGGGQGNNGRGGGNNRGN